MKEIFSSLITQKYVLNLTMSFLNNNKKHVAIIKFFLDLSLNNMLKP